MADSKKKSDKKADNADNACLAAIEARIKALDGDLDAIEQSKKQRSLVGLVGVVLIILGMALFLMNISSFFKQKARDKEFHAELLEKIGHDMLEVQNNPNLQALLEDLRNKILPDMADAIVERFKESAPDFQEKGQDIAGSLQDYLENDVKEKFTMSLAHSLLDVEGILKEKFPDISPDDIARVLDSAQRTFIEEVTNVIEERLDSVRIEIELLKESIAKFKDCEEFKKLDHTNPDTLAYAKLQMVEAMLELVIYQINEEKGNLRVVELPGGAK